MLTRTLLKGEFQDSIGRWYSIVYLALSQDISKVLILSVVCGEPL